MPRRTNFNSSKIPQPRGLKLAERLRKAEKMAKSKEDITYGAAQARVSEDDALRISYKAGTPLEGGKIAYSEPVDIFSSAHNIEKAKQQQEETGSAAQPQMQHDGGSREAAGSKKSSTKTS